jgi:hypothetical protein
MPNDVGTLKLFVDKGRIVETRATSVKFLRSKACETQVYESRAPHPLFFSISV